MQTWIDMYTCTWEVLIIVLMYTPHNQHFYRDYIILQLWDPIIWPEHENVDEWIHLLFYGEKKQTRFKNVHIFYFRRKKGCPMLICLLQYTETGPEYFYIYTHKQSFQTLLHKMHIVGTWILALTEDARWATIWARIPPPPDGIRLKCRSVPFKASNCNSNQKIKINYGWRITFLEEKNGKHQWFNRFSLEPQTNNGIWILDD